MKVSLIGVVSITEQVKHWSVCVSPYKAASEQTFAPLPPLPRIVKVFGSINYKLIGLNFVYINFTLNKIIAIKTILLRSEYKHKTNY